ncbi:hypothetical protein K505DRAFT_327449 [Melanomma pulvis-pyrius CBS 109.77]|uniref:Uncharacterized protein n=1 Tax=Melanomma pulvis-pyrius CBS 109.77 TaxID=1314802 RepID=A0A6A6X415_9PLEO|nr:hypothetical protein K505DRAFT_327449 [Melanomma pulvis-pyrius CBS 109.77]
MSTLSTQRDLKRGQYSQVSRETIEMSVRTSTELLPFPNPGERELPPFDEALSTRKRCQRGLVLSYLLSITLIICGIVSYVYVNRARNRAEAYRLNYPTDREDAVSGPVLDAEIFYPTLIVGKLSTGPKEVVTLAFNTIVTMVTECLGYVHSVSLRWALYHESRLHHNSSLRLFTSSRNSPPNSCYANVIWALLLTLCYSCASQILLTVDNQDDTLGFNSLAILLLGACLFMLSLLTTWTLLPPYGQQILSWNSDPLNTTLALLHETWSKPDTRPASIPIIKQPSIRTMHPRTRLILAYLCLLVPIICTGGAVLIYANRENGTDWAFINSNQDMAFISVVPASAGVLTQPVFWQAGPAIQIFFLAAIQVLYTLALHTVEQLVNLHRDEASWRAASKLDSQHGAVVGRESTKAAFTAWQTVSLSIVKPVSHWLFGLSFVVEPSRRVTIHPMPLFALAGIDVLLASFAIVLMYHRPRGAQPATYGDLKMLAEFVDDWGDGAGGRLFWGDKGEDHDEGGSVRRAGTSSSVQLVNGIGMDGASYKGIGGGPQKERPRRKAPAPWKRFTCRRRGDDRI